MDALNIHTIQANLKRLTPMQLQMEAQSQVVPQWLVALEQQRRATLQDGLASMQAPQQQTTVMEDLATKTAAPEPRSQPEGIAQYAEGGAVGKKNRWDSLLEDFNGSSDAFVVQSAPSTMEQMQEAGAPKSYINKLQSLWAEAQKRLDKPREYQPPAPAETTVETLGKTDNDTQPVGIEEAQYTAPMSQNLADRFTRLDEIAKTSPQAAKNTAEAFLQAGQGRSEYPPEYMQTLEAFVNQPLPYPTVPQPEQGIAQAVPQPASTPAPVQQPLPMKEETLAAPEPTLEALTPQGVEDTSPVQQTKFLGPEEMDALLSATPAEPAPAQGIEQALAQHEAALAQLQKQQSAPVTQASLPPPVQQEQGIPQVLPQPVPVQTAPKKPEIVVPPDVKPYWDLIKQGGEMPKPNLEGYDKKSERKEKQLKYAEDNNLSMALMSASAAILAGESPFTMVNLGKGFAAGLHQYANGRKNINDLQDQIDDVVMARDKAMNDQNMREFELQDRRLSVLATIKQRMDEAAGRNATEIQKANIMAGAHKYSTDRAVNSQNAREKGDAIRAINAAQSEVTAAQDGVRKITDSMEYIKATPLQQAQMMMEANARLQNAQNQLQAFKQYAGDLGISMPANVSGVSGSGVSAGKVKMIQENGNGQSSGIKVIGDK